jgi:hypothetical protein
MITVYIIDFRFSLYLIIDDNSIRQLLRSADVGDVADVSTLKMKTVCTSETQATSPT